MTAKRQDLELGVNVGRLGAGLWLMPKFGRDIADQIERVLVHGKSCFLRHPVMLHGIARQDKKQHCFQILYCLEGPVRLLSNDKRKRRYEQMTNG